MKKAYKDLAIALGIGIVKDFIKDTPVGYLVSEVESVADYISEKEAMLDNCIENHNKIEKLEKEAEEELFLLDELLEEYDDYVVSTEVLLDNDGFPKIKYKKKPKKKKQKTRKLFKNR